MQPFPVQRSIFFAATKAPEPFSRFVPGNPFIMLRHPNGPVTLAFTRYQPSLILRPMVTYRFDCEKSLNWERARKPEHKEVRRNAILDAARVLFSELKYGEISLNAIAREADISKPNVYRYFSSREEIFLAIFEEVHGTFVTNLIARLRRMRTQDVVGGIAKAWVEEALEQPALLDLLPQLSISMEENSSVEQLTGFKQRAYARVTELVETLRETYPELDAEAWSSVIQLAVSLMAGLWPLANPGENVIEAAKNSGHDMPPPDFTSMMKSGLTSFIHGEERG